MGSISEETFEEHMRSVHEKYDQERERRYRADGPAQFVNTTRSAKFQHYAADPWFDPNAPPRGRQDIPNELYTKFLIIGTGFGALLYGVRLVESGVRAEDITMVDTSNGFGGTWYWNRYPGLMCDVESSIYMPLLEETGYIPKHRYSYGQELREYAESIARQYGFDKTAMFRSTISHADWDEAKLEWQTRISIRSPHGRDNKVIVRSDFLIMAAGIIAHPKLPLLPGIDDFRGRIFHTSRWDYTFTGGSQENPAMANLKDKNVAIVGTGATAIQLVPELAKWAGKLYVFQRTPSSVDVRDQRPIDSEEFRRVCQGKGWQRKRRENWWAFTANSPDLPDVNLVDDAWTHMPSLSALIGSPRLKTMPREKTADYVAALYALDLPRQDRIRARVDEVVKDKTVADSLKPWYHGWCKRPCFHDDYLSAFNRPNVELVDTRGHGVDKITDKGLVFDTKHYDVDLIVLSTGYEVLGDGGPAHRANMTITGCNGLSLEDKWRDDLATLHGLFTRGFPNLILPGATQAGTAGNQVHFTDVYASHVAAVIAEARKNSKSGAGKVVIEPTKEGEDEWAGKVLSTVHGLSTMANCTPGYYTNEAHPGIKRTPAEQMTMARRAGWTPGLVDYCNEIEAWLASGDLSGLDIYSVPVKAAGA